MARVSREEMARDTARILLERISDEEDAPTPFGVDPDNPVHFVSGIVSPVYCHTNVVASHVGKRNQVLGYLRQILGDPSQYDGIASVATAAIPFGSMLAQQLELPHLYVRTKPREHGTANLVEGYLPPGGRVALIENVVTAATSSGPALQALRDEGLTVDTAFAIMSYGLPHAMSVYEQAGATLDTLTTVSKVLDIGEERRFLDAGNVAFARDWHERHQTWEPGEQR